jgi:hypothetical protein
MIREIKGRASHIRMFLGSAWPDNPKTFHSRAVHIISQGGRLTLKIAAVVFLLLAVMALEAAGALGTSDQPMREVDAGEILAKVEAGQPVEYDHVVVRGDLDLSRERLHRNITSPIKINDSIFEGKVDFNDSVIKMPVDLSGSNFARDAYFVGTAFSDDARFSWAAFSRNAYFEGTAFSSDTYFVGSAFSDDAHFREATFSCNASFLLAAFSGDAYLWEVTFNGDANFLLAAFSDSAYFDETEFSSDANFWGATFSGDADFEEAVFSGNAYFERATFSGDASFLWAVFSGNVDFEEAEFSGDADFMGADLIGNSSFEDAEFNANIEFGDARFENKTSFYRILFKRPAYFEDCSINSLDLTKAEYSRLHLRWGDIKSLNFDEAAYLALIKNYNTLGWYGDANRCYYDYRNAVRRSWQDASSPGFAVKVSSPLDRLVDFGEWLLYGYGVRPSFPIAWSAAIILAFGLFFWKKRCLRKIITEERIEDAKDGSDEVLVESKARKAPINFLDPFLFSLFTFTSGFTAFLHPAVEYKLERCLRWAIAERLLGPFFLALVITTISKTYLIR